MSRWLILVTLFLLASIGTACAGGDDGPRPAKAKAEPIVSPDPKIMNKALGQAREAAGGAAGGAARPAVAPPPAPRPTPVVPPRPAPTPTPVAARPSAGDGWKLASRDGGCAPLDTVSSKVSVGSFSTPQQFARQMHQRGHQSFVLDIGDQPDQKVRVKVPDLDLDLTFVQSTLCR